MANSGHFMTIYVTFLCSVLCSVLKNKREGQCIRDSN
jgi:hypothetical protein